MKKTKSIFLITMITLSFLASGLMLFASFTKSSEFEYPTPELLGPEFRDNSVDSLVTDVRALPTSLPSSSDSSLGDFELWIAYDDYYGYIYLDWFYLAYVGTYCEVWVQWDLAYYVEPVGDGWTEQDKPADVITDEQAIYMGMEFDTNIYANDVAYFGEPEFLDGSFGSYGSDSADGKTAILLSNVRDDLYYSVPNTVSFIAGFYWGSVFERYTDRNVITIDSYAWDHFVGDTPPDSSMFVYEGTIAHEFQHLIHDDWNTNDDTFMNEGCSMFAELVCGYPVDYGRIDDYFAVPDNSLTVWGDLGGGLILSDYGQVLLWATYLVDQYGDGFLTYFVQNGIPGVDGINTALEYFGYKDTFDDAFHNWRIANLIHSDKPGKGVYNYKRIDLDYAISEGLIDPIRTYEIGGKFVPPTTGTSFGTSQIVYHYSDGSTVIKDSGVSRLATFGTDYLKFTDLNGFTGILFDGDDSYWYGWQPTPYGWWSDAADNLDTTMTAEAYVDIDDPTLTFWTWYDIEENWDYGFVQVSTDGGVTWISLENAYSSNAFDAWPTDPDTGLFLEPWETMYNNLPGFTGYSGGWVYMEFDLSAYADQNVLIGYRYMTDWFTNYGGWYVDEAAVSGVALEMIPPDYPLGDFMVTMVVEQTLKHKSNYYVYDLYLCDAYELGMTLDLVGKKDTVYMIISPINPVGTVDYTISAFSYKPYKGHW